MLMPKAAGDLAKGQEFLWHCGVGWRLYRCTDHRGHKFAGPSRTLGTEYWPESLPKIVGEIEIYMAPLHVPSESGCHDIELAEYTVVLVSSTNQPMEKELASVC